jgi:hypothetical protein
MLLGYGGRNQYRVWNPIRKDIIVSRDVVFDEHIPSQVAIINVGPRSDDVLATSEDVATPQAGDKDSEDEMEEQEPARLPSSSGSEDELSHRRSS